MGMVKHETWTRGNGDKFVMLTAKEYRRLEELAEDAGLSRIMKESRKRQAGSPRTSLRQVKRELGMGKKRRKAEA
ncbi:MAG: hypothetical protein ABSB33_05700 [Tepidisphaeraceae bacterium]|jgi:hypothetical protein